jgi:hypothetical protein
VLRFTLDHGTPRIPIRIAGRRLDAIIDSGNGGGLLLPLSLAGSVPLRASLSRAGRVASALNEFELFRGELEGSVEIGQVKFANLTTKFHPFFKAK